MQDCAEAGAEPRADRRAHGVAETVYLVAGCSPHFEGAFPAGQGRAEPDRARAELFAAIRAGLDASVGVSAVARDADFSREYITRIRDGKAPKDAQP